MSAFLGCLLLIFISPKEDHMCPSNRKRKRARKYGFKLGHRQAQSLQNYCELKNSTPNQLIKSLLKYYVEDFTDEKLGKDKVDNKQLSLFEEKEPSYEQLDIFQML